MNKPTRLQPGDLIRIVAPASPLETHQLEPMQNLLTAEGFRVELGEHVLDRHGYLAGTDEARRHDLVQAFDDPSVKAIVCARGGYGASRFAADLDFAALAATRKFFIGFSDITVLHLGLNRAGLATAYAPMALSFTVERPPYVLDSFKQILHGRTATPADAPMGKAITGGTAEGIVTGGCLCLLTDSIGTQWEMDTKGKIVLIEDVDESPHRVDAMLTHLLNIGALQKAAGIVVGEMTRTDEKTDPGIGGVPWREIVTERLQGLGIPTILDYPFGHFTGMLSMPLGIRARLDADAGRLTYLEDLCE
ncbi:MAG: LD-carboxypeptidase [Armatimonadetes bacterium]|nr:LD-carboxypeptidase [Armatimonadota bacterium]